MRNGTRSTACHLPQSCEKITQPPDPTLICGFPVGFGSLFKRDPKPTGNPHIKVGSGGWVIFSQDCGRWHAVERVPFRIFRRSSNCHLASLPIAALSAL